jgi:integrase
MDRKDLIRLGTQFFADNPAIPDGEGGGNPKEEKEDLRLKNAAIESRTSLLKELGLTNPDDVDKLKEYIKSKKTAARVSELTDVRIRDVRLETPACITLHGKNDKIRTVPLMKQTVSLWKIILLKTVLTSVFMGIYRYSLTLAVKN